MSPPSRQALSCICTTGMGGRRPINMHPGPERKIFIFASLFCPVSMGIYLELVRSWDFKCVLGYKQKKL